MVGDILIREGDFRHAFPEDITGSIRLNGAWSEEELETWGTEAPMVVLDSLYADLESARYEMSSRPAAKPDAQPVTSPEQAAG